MRAKGEVDDMANHPEVAARTQELLGEARIVLRAIDSAIPEPFSADGLYEVLARGFLPVPYLWECRDEFPRALQWHTRLIHGSVKVVDDEGHPLSATERLAAAPGRRTTAESRSVPDSTSPRAGYAP